MPYVEGFVAAVPTTNREVFRKHATGVAAAFKDRGALKIVECWGDNVPDGSVTSLRQAVLCKAEGTVTFSWVVWPSRDARDKGMADFGDDPRMNPETNPMPFDGKRLIWSGFDMLVDQ